MNLEPQIGEAVSRALVVLFAPMLLIFAIVKIGRWLWRLRRRADR